MSIQTTNERSLCRYVTLKESLMGLRPRKSQASFQIILVSPEAGLFRTWSEAQIVGFLMQGLMRYKTTNATENNQHGCNQFAIKGNNTCVE